MDDLARWLGEQLDEDERITRAATPGPWHAQDGGVASDDDEQWPVGATESDRDREDRVHIAEWDPSRALREIDAKRKALAHYGRIRQHTRQGEDAYMLAEGAVTKQIQFMAASYDQRPGYREEWRP